MELDGYKAFNVDMTNRYGKKFEVGKIYRVDGIIEFGLMGNGYHFCKRLEDTLRYVDGMNSEIQIAKVRAFGDYREYYDEYYGYYDMFAAREIVVDEVLNRNKIIMEYLNTNADRVIRFIQGYRLLPYEIDIFKMKYCNNKNIINAIAYYQEHDLDVYTREAKKIYVKKGLL